jgi:hypothetical protein
LLSNIYLSKLDDFIQLLANNIYIGDRPKVSTEYNTLRSKRDWNKKKGNIRIAKTLTEEMLHVNYYKYDDSYKRIKYVRYADNFIIGTCTSYKEVTNIAKEIESFMLENLKLEVKFTIKDFKKETIKFLGVLIKNGNTQLRTFIKNNYKIKQRIKNRIQFYAPIEDIIKKLIDRGFLNKQREGIPKFL